MSSVSRPGRAPSYWANLRTIGVSDDVLQETDDHYRAVGRFLLEFESVGRTALLAVAPKADEDGPDSPAEAVRRSLLDGPLEAAMPSWFALLRPLAVHSEADEAIAARFEEQLGEYLRIREELRNDILSAPFRDPRDPKPEPTDGLRATTRLHYDSATAIDRLTDELWLFRHRLGDYGAYFASTGLSPLSTILRVRHDRISRLVPLSFEDEIQRSR